MEKDSDLPGSDYINANYIRVSRFGITLGLMSVKDQSFTHIC